MMRNTPGPAIPANPSDIACLELVNSAFTDHTGGGLDVDRLERAEWQRWFLDRYGLEVDTPQRPPVRELVELRRSLRRLLERWSRGAPLNAGDVRVLDDRVRAVPLRRRVVRRDGEVQVLDEPSRRDWVWMMGEVAASAVELVRGGEPTRLKTCANPKCSWMFYDETVNRSKRFCSATPCASLMRVRRFRS